MKFKTGKIINGKRDEGKIVDFDSWFAALDAILTAAGIYLCELDEKGEEVV
jgi:hypothetical protein